ncbi:cytochrome b [Sulfitobacter porphyrae]|uniref:Cytochrome b n=1 Tax=Sulfitobacter porphyrae TaxID=1246864 RepID=A0ABW2B1B0_9RHOB
MTQNHLSENFGTTVMATRSAYSGFQITLHWLIAILIAAAWFLGDGMGRVLDQRIAAGTTGIEGNTLHVWTGGAVFLLVLIRLVVRMASGVPDPVAGNPGWQDRAALWGHRALYLFMILVPALGAAAWYGHVKPAAEAHEIAVNLLVILIGGHTLMALYHHYVVRDGTLRRMLPFLR